MKGGLPQWLSGKESTCNAGAAGDAGSIPGSGRSSGRGHSNPLHYCCLENPMDRGAWRATVPRVTESLKVNNNWCNLAEWKVSVKKTWNGKSGRCFPREECHRKVRILWKRKWSAAPCALDPWERRKHISLGCHYDTPKMLCFVILEDNVESSEQSLKSRSPEKI